MSYAQFGYTTFPPTSQLMVGANVNPSVSSSSPTCCGDPDRVSAGLGSSAEGQAPVCSLPATYDSRLLTSYPRLAAPSGLYPGASPYHTDHQPYPNFESSAFYPSLSTAYGMKDATDPWRGITPSASYYYDPSLAAYGYGGLDFNGARRKNVTRDSTSTLKAWLNEHRKNPYPTKGEKIMLAIITKMTLTQVSTWFANARRRLKKENKMTWEPRNKMDTDDVKDFGDDDDDDDDKTEGNNNNENKRSVNNGDNNENSERGGTDPHGDANNLRPAIDRCDSGDDSDDGGRQMTSGDNSVDGVVQYGGTDEGIARTGYQLLRHPNIISDSLSRSLSMNPCRSSDRNNPSEAPTILPPSDFTPTDSSSPPNIPDIRTLIRSPEEGNPIENKGRNPSSMNNSSTSSSNNNSVDIGEQLSGSSNKPKIWSLADTATSKSPPVSSQNFPEMMSEVNPSGTVADMLGHCGWFSVNPYQVNGSPSTLGGFTSYHHAPAFVSPGGNGGGMFGSGSSSVSGSSGVGFSPVPPQTDTPPQTPPNMKVSTALPSGYISGQSAHLYVGQTAASAAGLRTGGSLSTAMHVKNVGMYPVNHRTSSIRSYRSELLPEDFSTSGQFRSAPI